MNDETLPYKTHRTADAVPTAWYNLRADMKQKPAPLLNPGTLQPVTAKATSELHGKILEKLGADQVVFPDRESAHRLARCITNRGAFDLLEISEGYSIAEIKVPEVCKDKTLAQADLRNRTGVTVLCIRRRDENPKKPRAIIVPGPNDQIHADDKLIVFGTTKQIDSVTDET